MNMASLLRKETFRFAICAKVITLFLDGIWKSQWQLYMLVVNLAVI